MKRLLACILAGMTVLVVSCPALGAPMPAGAGVRALSMGGAYTAVAEGPSAPYWNPAGIAQSSFSIGGGLRIPGTLPTLVKGAVALFDATWQSFDFSYLEDGTVLAPWVLDQLVMLGSSLNDQFPGTPVSLLGSSYGGVITPWIALSTVGDMQTDFQTVMLAAGMPVPDGAMSISETVLLTGAFKSTKPPIDIEWLSVGLNAKGTVSAEIVTSADTGSGLYTMDLSYGYGASFDLGMLFQVGKAVRMGVVAKDLFWFGTGNTWTYQEYWDGTPLGSPTSAPWTPVGASPTLNLGIAYAPPKIGMTLTADLHGIRLTQTGTSEPFSINIGLEQVYGSTALRAGAVVYKLPTTYLANFTAGVGLALGSFHLDIGGIYGAGQPFTLMGSAGLEL